MWAVVGISGKWVIPFLLGKDFQFSGQIITILSPIMFLKAISFACAVVLVSVGWQHKRLIYQIIAAVFNIAANIYIIPLFQVTGVAWVYVISELIIVLGYLWETSQWIQKGQYHQTDQ